LEYFEHSSIPKTESESQQTTTTENHVEGEEDIVAKLRQENDLLREVIIRSTREEVVNFREDSVRIRSPREYPSLFGKKGIFSPPGSENSPRSAPELPILTSPAPTTSTPAVSTTNTQATATDDSKPTEGRKSTKLSNSFIRKQNSAKKIQQKVSKVIKDVDTGNTSNGRETLHKREHSASSSRKSLVRKDTVSENTVQLDKKLSVLEFALPTVIPSPAVTTVPSSSDVKLPPLQSINEATSKQKEESDQKSSGYTPRNSQGETSNNARSRRSVRVHEEIPGVSKPQQPAPLSTRTVVPQANAPIPSPGKPSLFRSTTIGSAISSALGRNGSLVVATNSKGAGAGTVAGAVAVAGVSALSENNENIPPAVNTPVAEPSTEKEGTSTSPRHKVTLPDVFQKVNELERKFSGKERALELEHATMKKQVEEMKVSLDTLVMAITQLTEKIIT
jgi:hypothetical protein